MPSFNDLEFQDLNEQLKPPYMDATLLLDTLSTEDIDWQSYNLFSDENLNSSLKDQIKEENIDIDVLSSICPNDLLNNMDEMEHQYKSVGHLQQQDPSHIHLNHLHYHHMNGHDHPHHQLHHLAHHHPHHVAAPPAYHHFASSSSSSSSIDSLGYQTGHVDESHNGSGGEHVGCQFGHLSHNSESSMQGMGIGGLAGVYSEQEPCFSTTSSPLSSSSSSPSAISTSPNGMDFAGQHHGYGGYHSTSLSHKSMSANTLNQKIAGLYQIQNIKTCPPSTIQHQLIKNIHANASSAQSPIMMVPSCVAGQSSATLSPTSTSSSSNSILLVETSSKLSTNAPVSSGSSKLSKSNILPLSPPSSSVGSDSESSRSSSSSSDSTSAEPVAPPTSKKQNKSSLKSKGLNKNGLKSSSSKQSRHHPYPIKSSAKQISPALKSSSSLSSSSTSVKNACTSNSLDEDCWPFLCSLSKLPTSGPLMLTEEEKRTLVQEGHQVPSQLPLSKGEEKILKKIRRKIKNKISAQESRRKKKEYVDSLEKRMENYINENVELKKRLEDLELNNKSLLSQLQKMQISLSNQQEGGNASSNALVSNPIGSLFSTNNANATGQFGTLFMVLVLFFAVVLGVWSPVLTKDQIASSSATAATAAAAAHASARSTTSSTAAVVVATATAAATAATVATIKTEAVSPAPVQSQSAPPTPSVANSSSSAAAAEQQMDTNESTFSPGPFAGKSGAAVAAGDSRVLTPTSNEDEAMSFETSPAASSACNPVNSNVEQKNVAITRSKTGTAVELTKVRPFVRKLPGCVAKSGESSSPVSIPAALVNATNLASGNQLVEMTASSSEEMAPLSSASSSSLSSSSPVTASTLAAAAAASSSSSSSSSPSSSQVIILNLASNSNSTNGQASSSSSTSLTANAQATTSCVDHSSADTCSSAISTATVSNGGFVTTKPILANNITILSGPKSVITLNGGSVTPSVNGSNFRIINTSQVSGSSVSSLSDLALSASGTGGAPAVPASTKMTTRFRLINNPVGSSVVVGQPSVIKLNTSA